MVEKRSTGWAGRRGEDSAKSITPRRKPRDEPSPSHPSRSLYKPVFSIASVYGTIVLLVWQLWTGNSGKSHETPETPSSGSKPNYAESSKKEGLLPVSDSQTSAELAFARSATQTKALMAEIMPRMSQSKVIEPYNYADTFDTGGDYLHVSWGWTYQSLVGDQRTPAQATGLVPRIFEERGSNLGWQSFFELLLTNGDKVLAKDCSLLRRTRLPRSQEDGFLLLAGEAIELQCPLGIHVYWTAALLRMAAGAEVLRIRFWYESNPELSVMSLTLWDFDSALMAVCGSKQAQSFDHNDCFGASGEVDGSPLIHIGRGIWVALEHPRAVHGLRSNGTRVVAELRDASPGTPYFASAGITGPIGATAEESVFLLRRHFQAYLQQVRASPPKPFLHFTTWYDLRRHPCVDSSPLGLPHCSAAKVLNEQHVLQRMEEVAQQLSQRGVTLAGGVLDDGWDDAGVPWNVNRDNFPEGFSSLAKAANDKGMSLGVWMSPWGGFGEAGKRRVKIGASMGFEYQGDSPNLLRFSGRRYFDWFYNATLRLLHSGLSFFKFDGIGSGVKASGSAENSKDVDNLLFLIQELRAQKQVRVSAVTGSWPSPWWLCSVDSVWRGGPDLGRKGTGSLRQQWMTFRDSMVFEVLRRARLFPLASLSLGGLVWSRAEEPGAYLNSFDLEDFSQEVQGMIFTMYQELQIQPSLLAPESWDTLALHFNLSHKHAAVLHDSHWLGGDPARGEAYGYGAFDCPPCSGLLLWRNPSAEAQNITFTLRAALALPQAWPGGAVGGRWQIKAVGGPGPADSDPSWEVVPLDHTLPLRLAALQVRSFEVTQAEVRGGPTSPTETQAAGRGQ
ncbi:unnamed protein product [Symbiodinium microadriaticum]|nr:unnamed protein product [Symbiodinium microadriaticum]